MLGDEERSLHITRLIFNFHLAKEFPDNVATMFAILETFFGIGMIMGPTVGGALYELGGFTLPFVALGSVLVGAAIFCSFLLPSSRDENQVRMT